MPFQVSPGVNVTEIDLTTVVPAVSTTEGAIAGVFRWGPVDKRVLVDSENTLAFRFGKPTNLNAETFFTAANFLSYGNKLYVARVGNTTPNTAYALGGIITGASNTQVIIGNTGQNDTFLRLTGNIGTGDYVFGTGVPAGTKVVSITANTTEANVVLSAKLANTANTLSFVTATDSLITAVAGNTATISDFSKTIIKNDDLIDDSTVASNITDLTDVRFFARYPGEIGNSLKVSVCDTANAFTSNAVLYGYANNEANANLSTNTSITTIVANNGSNTFSVFIGQSNLGTIAEAVTKAGAVRDSISVGDLIELGNNTIGTQFLKVTSVGAVSNSATQAFFTVNAATRFTLANFGNTASAQTLKRNWEYFQNVDKAPGTSNYNANFGNSAAVDEIHVVVEDEDGFITGVPGTILETFQGLSRATNAKSDNGSTIYVKDVINQSSQFVYFGNGRSTGYTNTAVNMLSLANTLPLTLSFDAGSDGPNETDVTIGELISGYDLFKSAEDVDVSLILQGKARGGVANTQLSNHLIDNIAESRKDCVVFVSPDKADVVLNSAGDEADDIVAFRNALTSTSYAVIDSGYKYQYDKYNDIYRYIPLNGDVAGLCVRTDDTRDPWYSPAGFNRGIIKNTVKLAFNPNKAQRDILYKNGVNPVVTFPGQGTLLFGDKTALAKPSAFDRINVRRLFIVLEKAIATAAKFTLFEFNDEFTRAQFRNLVEPFLRDVQGRRGITDFKVVCDETNNTGEVIDRNEFVGDIYIKPARSINFIQLNFVAVRTGVEFSEIVGQF
jgi:hypothetical protein